MSWGQFHQRSYFLLLYIRFTKFVRRNWPKFTVDECTVEIVHFIAPPGIIGHEFYPGISQTHSSQIKSRIKDAKTTDCLCKLCNFDARLSVFGCHDQGSNLGSGSNDSPPEVTNHYLEMTECGRNLKNGLIPRPVDKSVINSCQFYMNLFANDIVNFNETKRKEEEKIKWKRKKQYLSFNVPRSFRPHKPYTRCFRESPDVVPHLITIHRSRVVNARSWINVPT